MKLIEVEHKGIMYEFRLLEATNCLQVSKDGRFTYEANLSAGLWHCSCPGGHYRGNCWHLAMLIPLAEASPICEPWAQWAEAAELERRARNGRQGS